MFGICMQISMKSIRNMPEDMLKKTRKYALFKRKIDKYALFYSIFQDSSVTVDNQMFFQVLKSEILALVTENVLVS